MDTLPNQKSPEQEAWVNSATKRVSAWLRVDCSTQQLVFGWNEDGGLGVELADAMDDLVRTTLGLWMSRPAVWWKLRNVNWNQLAEQFAYELCGVTEAELIERREMLLQFSSSSAKMNTDTPTEETA